MINFFSVPDKEKNYQSYMVYVLAIMWAFVISGTVSMGFFYFPLLWQRWLTFIVVSFLIGAVTLTINSLKYSRLASIILTGTIWLLITIPCYSAGGIMAPGILSQMSVILTAGFLLGWRGGLAIGLLTIGTDFWLAYIEVKGNLPVPTVTHNPLTRWIGAIIPFGTILALQYYATNHLRTSLIALQREIKKREQAEKILKQTVHNLRERVKEQKTLYAVSNILQNENTPIKKLLQEIAAILPSGWQYPDITAARICFAGTTYATDNYKPTSYSQHAEIKTNSGSMLHIEVVYLQQVPDMDEGPFVKEERNLINMIAEMVKINLERRERTAELNDYKYALDIGSMVSISGADECFTFVNDNFCKTSKYTSAELMGKNYGIIMSGYHPREYFKELEIALQRGKPYRGEFCNKAKDGTLYWVDTTIVPFVDDNGKIYQYLSINYDITERKEADNKIKQSEQLLKKITSQVPGNTYLFEIEESGHSKILFISRGTDTVNHNYGFDELSEKPEILREILHEDDKVKFNDTMKEAYRTESMISFQYRIVINGNIRWRWMQAVPEKDKDGKTLWYGSTSDITPLVDYLASIEQIIFDISHVMRRPVSTMLGLSKLIIDGDLSENEIKDLSQKLYHISEEMDKFIHELNTDYQQKKQKTKNHIDISSTIDKRSTLFQ
ncbi:MAG: PAS domain-containing protein [Bacteroidota bacterium]